MAAGRIDAAGVADIAPERILAVARASVVRGAVNLSDVGIGTGIHDLGVAIGIRIAPRRRRGVVDRRGVGR